MRHAVALLALAAGIAPGALGACGDGSPPIIDDPAGFLAALRVTECDHLVRCHVFTDTAQCERRIAHPGLAFSIWTRPPGEAAWADHVAGGTMRFDPAQAGACIEALRRGTCAPEERFPACWQVFHGTAPDGAVTTSERECASQHWITTECDEACCTGVCGPSNLPPAGHPTTIEGIGDFCGLDAEGFVSCPSHLACRDNACALLGDGDTCTGSFECPAGLVCDGECRRRDELGERCTRGQDGDSCAHVGAWCGDDGRCQPLALEDEACSLSAPCRHGMHCDPATRRCVAVYAEGEACGATSAPCDTGLACVVAEGEPRCAPTGAVPPVCD